MLSIVERSIATRALTGDAGVRQIRFHDLRHVAASLMIAAGIDIALVSKRMGHSTISVASDF